MLLHAAQVLTLNAAHAHLHDAGILIENGAIIAVDPWSAFEGATAPVTDLGNRLVMPGLINAHTHTPMTLFRGLAEGYCLLGMEGWYNGIRVWELAMTREMVPPAVLVSCAEMIRTGTTCFNDQYFYMDHIVPAVQQSGLRAALGYGIVEIGDARAQEWAIQEADAFIGSLRDDPLLKGWVGPHAFFVDNSVATIQKELALADRHNTGFHIHMSTTGEEDAFCHKHYGMSAVQKMAEIGVFEFPVIAAHCLSIPAQDFPTLAQSPFTALIAPSSCMRAGKTAAPLKAMLDAGIAAALGTDNVTANNSYDMFKEMQVLGKLMSYREGVPNPISSQKIVEMATIDGARALGLQNEVGSLEPGKRADLIALDLDEVGWSPRGAQDIYTALVYSINGLYVTDTLVDGRWLMRDRTLQTVDYRAASRDLDAAFVELQARRASIEATS